MSPDRKILFVALFVLLLGGAVLGVGHPLLAAWYHSDDFTLLALGKFAPTPFHALVENQFPGAYYFRPAGLAFWWLSQRVPGADAGLHYLLSLLLHGGNALLIAAVARSAGGRAVPAAALALLFALHPVAIGTSAWLSSRFDLLATGAVLLALLFALRGRGTLAVAAAITAMLAKESAAPVYLALAAHAVLAAPAGSRWRALLLWALPLSGYVAWRISIIGLGAGSGNPLDGLHWLWASGPTYLGGLYPLQIGGSWHLLAALPLLLLLAGNRRRALTPVLLLLLAALGGTLAIQTLGASVLPPAAPTATQTNLAIINSRFWYLPLALVACLLGSLAPPAGRAARRVLAACALVLAVVWGNASHTLAEAWRQHYPARQQQAMSQLITQLRATAPASGPCVLHLPQAERAIPQLHGYTDTAVKAMLPSGDPLERCALFGTITPYVHILRAGHAMPPGVPPPRQAPTVTRGFTLHYLRTP